MTVIVDPGLEDVLAQVADGRLSPLAAAARLAAPTGELAFAHVDHDRARRCGAAEVIYGPGKTTDQLLAIAREVLTRSPLALATRVDADAGRALTSALGGVYHARSRLAVIRKGPAIEPRGQVAVVSAGTSDEPVAEEAAEVARALGATVTVTQDVGVAGLHRLAPVLPTLRAADAVVVVAGMEGALPSVVAGLIDVPVVAVPTSVGYGASFGGLAALLGMLAGCAAGVATVNIDNGFGAGYYAARIARRAAARTDTSS